MPFQHGPATDTGSTRCRKQHPPQEMPAGTWSSCSCTGHSSGLILMPLSAQAAPFPKDKGKTLHGRTSNSSHGVDKSFSQSCTQRGQRAHPHLGVFMSPAASTDSHVK